MTIKELLAKSVQQRGDSVALRYKRKECWETVSYHELLARVRHVAEVLHRFHIKPGDRVAIFSENVPEWPVVYFGIVGIGAIAVPVDAKLQEQEVAHILRDSGAQLLLAGAKIYPLLRDIEPHVPDLQTVLLIDGRENLSIRGPRIQYLNYESLMRDVAPEAGSSVRAYDKQHPSGEDIASLLYTSGTTGRQKGAMLTHRNFTSNVEGCRKAIGVLPSDNFLLVLPLHHSFAFTTNLLLPIAVGSEISFVENLKTIGENMREVSPTVLIGVPLLLEKMYNRIWNGIQENKLGTLLFKLGIRKPILSGIAQKLGGRLRFIVTGGAPCDPELIEGYGRLGISIIEGYGLTETAPVLSSEPTRSSQAGHRGQTPARRRNCDPGCGFKWCG